MGEVLTLDPRAVAGEAAGLVLDGDCDARAVALDGAAVIAVRFAPWRDGRGYSIARILRERGYAGDLRAVGDLTVDQLLFLRRAGFSSVEPVRAIAPEQAAEALGRFPAVYQRAADDGEPAWRLRQR